MFSFHSIVFYFLFYSFLGWIVEGLFNLATAKQFKKPNFLYIPIKPMYGIASVCLVISYKFVPFWLFILLSFIIPSLVEYVTAALMKNCFDVTFWDYSHKSFNLKGFICLEFSSYWIILSLFTVYIVQPITLPLYTFLEPLWHWIYPLVLVYLLFDLCFTLRAYRTGIRSQIK